MNEIIYPRMLKYQLPPNSVNACDISYDGFKKAKLEDIVIKLTLPVVMPIRKSNITLKVNTNTAKFLKFISAPYWLLLWQLLAIG